MLRDREVVNYCRLGNSGIRMFAALFIAALLFFWPGAEEAQAISFTNISSARFANLSSMSTPRYRHTATLLSNGKVLVAGGTFDNFSSSTMSTQLYSPRIGKFEPPHAANMFVPRSGHTATMLQNGRVLLAGGRTGSSPTAATSSVAVYNPLSDDFTTKAPLTTPRYGHTATRLNDGRVLFTGGIDVSGAVTASVEIYDPVNNTYFGTALTLNTPRAWHSATLLTDGRVVIIGGVNSASSRIEVFDPGTNTISSDPSFLLPDIRSKHAAVMRPDGTILVIGGNGGTATEIVTVMSTLASSTVAAGPSLQVPRYEPTATLLPNGDIVVVGGLPATLPPLKIEILRGNNAQFENLSVGTNDIVGHTATLLPDGSVLVLGGKGAYFGPVIAATAQSIIFTGRSKAIAALMPADTLNGGRQGHSSTRLADGRVLIAGGNTTSSPGTHNTGLLYDPGTKTFTPAASNMNSPRAYHTATLLANGSVLLMGGQDAAAAPLASAELFDPVSNTFAALPLPAAPIPRYRHTATLLQDGRVLIAGGQDATAPLASIQIFTPGAGFQASAASLLTARTNHTATLLKDGRVLFTGGENPIPTSISSAEFYFPDTDTVTGAPGNMTAPRTRHQASMLPDGNVLITSGVAATAEIFNTALSLFQGSSAMSNGHQGGTATVLSDGSVLIAGGGGGSSSMDIFDPATRTFSFSPSVLLSSPRIEHAASLLGDGTVLITGGDTGAPLTLDSADLYELEIPPGRRPVIAPFTTPPVIPIPPQPLQPVLAGTLFSGDSEGSGGASPSAVNHPVLTVQHLQNGYISSAEVDPAVPWNSTSLTAMTLPGSLPQGVYAVTITASGVPSIARSFFVRPLLSASSPFALGTTSAGVQSAEQLLPIMNTGNVPLKVTGISLGGTDAAMFSMTAGGNCATPPFSLPQNTGCSIGIVFNPPNVTPNGSRSAVVTILSDDPDHILAPFTVSLSGTVSTTPPSTTTISGQVTDGGGAMLQGVSVLAYNASTDAFVSSAATDPNGNYTIPSLPDGSYKVLFLSATFARQYYNGKFDVVNATPVATSIAAPATGINAVLTAGGSISGRVTDPSGAGIGSVVVYPFLMSGTTASFVGAGVTTDTSGNYAIGNLPPGSYKIQFIGSASLMGYYNGKQGLASADPVTVAASTVTSLGDSVLQPAAPPGPRTVSGSISFSGTKRAYIVVGEEFGTSVPAGSSTFTINGVPPGIFPIYAFVDSHDTGTSHLSDPLYMGQVDTTSGSATMTITPAVPTAPSLIPAPGSIKVTPGNGGVFVRWGTPRDKVFYRAEVADSYTVYWSTSPNPGPGSTVGGGSKSVTANDEGHLMIPGLINGSDYYFSVTATYGTLESAPSPVIGPVRIGSPSTSGVPVSGTISLSGITASGPLYVILEDWKKQTYGTAVASPTSSQAFSIPGVPDGTYRLYAFIDQNNNQVIDLGDPRMAGDSKTVVTVSGAAVTGVAASLNSAGAIASVTTNHHKSGGSEWYELNFDVYENVKRPVTATLQSSTSFAGPIDLGNSDGNRFHVWINVPSAPVGNEIYTILVTYGDGTSETLSAAVTGVLNDFAVPTGPANGDTVTDGLSFTWSAPTPAPAYPFAYKVELFSNASSSGKMRWDTDNFIPSSQTTVPYNYDFKGPFAISNGGYNWTVTVQDINGNRASVETPFTLSITTPPAITAISPAAGATNVALNGEFKLTFSREMDASSLDGTITSSTGATVKGRMAFDPFSRTASLRPDAPLSPGTTYTATLTTAKDIVGNSVSGLPLTMSFTTGTAAQVQTGTDGVTINPVKMSTPGADISIPAGTKLTDANGNPVSGTLTMSASVLSSPSSLPGTAGTAQASDGSSLVALGAAIDIAITAGTSAVKNINPFMMVNLAIPSTFALPGATVQYYSFDGTTWKLEGTATIQADGTVAMKVTHLSLWAVAQFQKLPSGDLNGDGKVDMADALQALKIAVGLVPQATGYKIDGDVAPLVSGKPAAARKGYITVGDAIVILEKTLNIVSW